MYHIATAHINRAQVGERRCVVGNIYYYVGVACNVHLNQTAQIQVVRLPFPTATEIEISAAFGAY